MYLTIYYHTFEDFTKTAIDLILDNYSFGLFKIKQSSISIYISILIRAANKRARGTDFDEYKSVKTLKKYK